MCLFVCSTFRSLQYTRIFRYSSAARVLITLWWTRFTHNVLLWLLTEDYGLKLLTAMTNVLQNPLTHSLNEHKEKSIIRMMENVV